MEISFGHKMRNIIILLLLVIIICPTPTPTPTPTPKPGDEETVPAKLKGILPTNNGF